MNKKLLPLLIFSALFFFAFRSTQNTDDLLEKIATQLKKYSTTSPQEKVYVHLDKPYYRMGETIWMKAYLFDGIGHAVDSVSRILYIDLINPSNGTVVTTRKLLCKGTAVGEIALPDTLQEGNYTIRAYTNYMRNFSEDFFFQHNFQLWNASSDNSLSKQKSLKKNFNIADLQFFPEGGNFVMGMPARLGFKAIASNGLGVDVSGFVLDENKDTVLHFQSEHLGMGAFEYIPKPNKTYTAFLQKIDGKYQGFDLPKASETGFTMMVDNLSNTENIKVYVAQKGENAPVKPTPVVLVAHLRGQLTFMAKGNCSTKKLLFLIPKNTIPSSGIMPITLMDSTGAVILERLIFHDDHNRMSVTIQSNKKTYKKREQVDLTITAKDNEGRPVEGEFSLSVTDKSQVLTNPHQQNLVSYMLLSSDASAIYPAGNYSPNNYTLRGNIEQPAYYFDQQNLQASRHLDILMMTQGWRRFDWSTIMENESQPASTSFFVETGVELKGKVTKNNGKNAGAISLTLMYNKVKNKQPIIKIEKSDAEGNFVFYDLDILDTTTVLLQALNKNGKKSDMTINLLPQTSPPKVKVVQTPLLPMEFDAKELQTFLQKANETIEIEKKLTFNKVNMLDEVVIESKRKESNTSFSQYGLASKSVKIENGKCTGVTDIYELLQTLNVAGLRIIPTAHGEYRVTLGGGFHSFNSNDGPMFVIDNMEVPRDMINSLRPCDVEIINVYKPVDAAVAGFNSPGGAIYFHTKRGNSNYDYSNDPASGVTLRKIIGYQTPAEFYSPKYNVQDPRHYQPDFRPTVYWQARVKTNANGIGTVTFWNSDAKSTMNVIAEGIANDGQLGTAQFNYELK